MAIYLEKIEENEKKIKHDQAEMLRASGVSENDLFDLCDKKSSENGKSSSDDADEDQMSFYDNE